MAPVTISWRDIAAWCDLTGERLLPWEARLIIRLSVMRATVANEEAKTVGH